MVVKLKIFVAFLAMFGIFHASCQQKTPPADTPSEIHAPPPSATKLPIVTGAARLSEYLPLLKGKRVGTVVNHTSLVGKTHLVDTLLQSGIEVTKIFGPEHGFRGTAADGELLTNGKDPATGVMVISLYGKNKKPSKADLAGLDLVVFDIQDVGTRFYTYISTMSYVMEACAENGIPVLILDRPNPNGHLVDGPILKKSHSSFVGLHEVPVAHGMTVGEYAQMVNGEGWLAGGIHCDLTVIACENYDHQTFYDLPVAPSPNLPNMTAIYLYPSLCFFEGTVASIGRGTNKQFQVVGAPGFPKGDFTFTPVSMESSKYPPQEGKLCQGYDFSGLDIAELRGRNSLNLSYLLDFYRDYPDKEHFFLETLYFDKLAGSPELRQQIIKGMSEAEIRATWQEGLAAFKMVREKYLEY